MGSGRAKDKHQEKLGKLGKTAGRNRNPATFGIRSR